MESQSSRPSWSIACLLIFPVFIYFILIWIYAYNFPFLDDYTTVLVHALQPAAEQLKGWFVPHNEHIHLILKATASFDLWIFGDVNLVRHQWLGGFVFLLFYGVLLRTQANENIPWIWLAPLPFLLFQPSYWGTITWSTTSLHNFPGLLFALATIRLWSSTRENDKWLALLFTSLALLTNGFGMAVLGTLILWELYKYWNLRKGSASYSKKALISLISLTVVWIAFRFFLGRTHLQANMEGNTPIEYLHFFTNFIGSCFHFLGSPWLNLLAVLMVALLALLIKNGLLKKHPVLFFFVVYLLLSAVMTTVARTDLGAKQGLASRYRIYSTLLLCCVYLGYAKLYWKEWRIKSWILPLLFAGSISFYSISLFVNLNNLNKIKQRLIADKQRWHSGNPIQEYLNARDAKLILNEADQAGVFPKTTDKP